MYKGFIVGSTMFLKDCIYQRLRRTCINISQRLIKNLKAESIWENFIKSTLKLQFLRKKGTLSRKLCMIASVSQMVRGPDLDSGSFITYFCKKKVLRVVWFRCNIWTLVYGNCILVLTLTCPSLSNLEEFCPFKQIALSFMLYPPHTAPLSLRSQILHSNLSLI